MTLLFFFFLIQSLGYRKLAAVEHLPSESCGTAFAAAVIFPGMIILLCVPAKCVVLPRSHRKALIISHQSCRTICTTLRQQSKANAFRFKTADRCDNAHFHSVFRLTTAKLSAWSSAQWLLAARESGIIAAWDIPGLLQSKQKASSPRAMDCLSSVEEEKQHNEDFGFLDPPSVFTDGTQRDTQAAKTTSLPLGT